MEPIVRTCVAAHRGALLAGALLLTTIDVTQATGSSRLPPEFSIGARVSVKGEFEPDGVLRARELELEEPGPDEELRGLIEAIDPATRRLRLLGFDVSVPEAAELEREPSGSVTFGELAVGQRVRVYLQRDASGAMVAKKIRVRAEVYPERRYVGTIEAIGDAPEGDVTLTLLGRRVRITERTELLIPGSNPRRLPPRARAATADDDLLLLGNIRPIPQVAISGELRLRGEILENRDLDDLTRDGDTVPEFLGIVGGLGRFGPVDIYAELSARRQFFLDGGPALGSENEKNLLNLSQLYLRYGKAIGDGWWRVQLGRQRISDSRQWLIYTKNLDTIRVLAGYKRWSIETAYGRALFNKDHFTSEQTRDNLYVSTSFALTPEAELAAFYLDRHDRTKLFDSPRLYGLRAVGDAGRYVEFWADFAWERGERGVTDAVTARLRPVPIRAEAHDFGLTLRPRWRGDPSLTIGRARGSGGDDESAMLSGQVRTAGTFRQSGFERNRGSFNGVVSFSYYGELFDPELANLRIDTVGVGLRPRRSLSFDLIYHDYQQDTLSRRRVHGSPLDAKPTGGAPDLGHEWDLIVGFEPSRLVELRLTMGRFSPGEAFPDSRDQASIFSFQSKLRF